MGIIFGGFGFVILMTLSIALQLYQSVLGTAGALFGLSYYVVVALLTWVMGLIHNGTFLAMSVYFLALSVISMIVYFYFIKSEHSA